MPSASSWTSACWAATRFQATICVGDEVQAVGADALAVEGGEAELAVVAVEEEVVQGVHRLVLVELAADRLALLGAGVVAQDEPGLDDPPVLLQRAGELAAVRVRLEPLHEQAGGDVPVLDRRGDPQQLIPVLGDQLRVDRMVQQPPGGRVMRHSGQVVEPPVREAGEVRAEVELEQVEQAEDQVRK